MPSDLSSPRLAAGSLGVVAAGHPATVEAAVTLLEAGGNAFDAVLAAGFAAAVAEPCLSSLAGGGFLLAAPVGGRERAIDFFVDTPGRGLTGATPRPELTPVTLRFGGASQIFHVGAASIATPGCLTGYLHVHRTLGHAPLREIVEPAVALARDGVVLGAQQAGVVRLLRPIFSLGDVARRMFVPEDRAFADDEVVTNPALADTLDAIGSGTLRGFGDPGVVDAIVDEVAAGGGMLTREDLRAYRVVERAPIRVVDPAQRWTLLTNPPPSFGGSLIGRCLLALAQQGRAGSIGSAARMRQFAEVLQAATRVHHGDDAALPALPVVMPPTRADGSWDGAQVEPAVAVEVADPDLRSSRGTTHISVADAAGNLASMTTSNGSGSGLTLGPTGALANNIMGESDLHPGGFHRAPPGQRVGSMMAPSVLRRRGAADVALGSGGSERIRSALTQTIAHLIDDHSTLADAVGAARIHVVDGVVQAEPGIGAAAVEALAEAFEVNVWEVTDLYFGGVNAVAADGSHAADHRRGGVARVVADPDVTTAIDEG